MLLTFFMAIDGLANSRNAPKVFLKVSANGLPYVSVAFNATFALLAYMGIKSGSGRVFGWLANMAAVAGLMTWFGISLTYLRFYKGMKAQRIDRSRLPFFSNLQPFAAWYSAVACLFISFVCHPLSAWLSEVLISINSSLADGLFSSKNTGQLLSL